MRYLVATLEEAVHEVQKIVGGKTSAGVIR